MGDLDVEVRQLLNKQLLAPLTRDVLSPCRRRFGNETRAIVLCIHNLFIRPPASLFRQEKGELGEVTARPWTERPGVAFLHVSVFANFTGPSFCPLTGPAVHTSIFVGSEVITAVKTSMSVFWVATPPIFSHVASQPEG